MGTVAAAPSAGSLHSVFVYGSLMADEVVSVLIRRVPSSSPAALHDHRRYSIKGRNYPAILPVQDETVNGKVLFGITDSELDVLDAFEDVEYERRSVSVRTPDSMETLKAYAYIWVNQTDPDLYGDWDFEIWKNLHMKKFLETSVAFMEDLEEYNSASRIKLQD